MRNDCNNKKLFTEIKWYIHAMAVRYGQLVNHLFYHRNAFKTVRKFFNFSAIPFSTDQENGVVQENVKSQQY